MQCVAYGLSNDRLTPHPFNLWNNPGSTHIVYFPNTTSGYDSEHVHSTSLVDMARPVLSGTYLVKLLYGLGHRAAAQF